MIGLQGKGPGRVGGSGTTKPAESAPGKRTLVEQAYHEAADPAARSGFSGTPTDVPHRAEMEHGFGRSFAEVKAYRGPEAQAANKALGAEAYTVGNQVAFAEASPSKETVAHELTHVVQQIANATVQTRLTVSSPADPLELEADRVARTVAAGGIVAGQITTGAASTAVHRKNAPPDLGNYDSAVGKQVIKLRELDDTKLIARRTELQGTLSRVDLKQTRDDVILEYEAIEWVANERHLALPKDPDEDAAPADPYSRVGQGTGRRPVKFWVPDDAQRMRALLEREAAADTGYEISRAHSLQRIDGATRSQSPADKDKHRLGHAQVALMDHDVAVFQKAFKSEAHQTALAMLDQSSIAIDTVLRDYGIVGGAHMTFAARNVARDPDSLDAEVDTWVSLSEKSDDNRGAFVRGHGKRDALVAEANKLRALQEAIDALAKERLRLMTLVGRRHHPEIPRSPVSPVRNPKLLEEVFNFGRKVPMQGSSPPNPFDNIKQDPSPRTPEEALASIETLLTHQRNEFKAAWIQAERSHPILATYRGKTANGHELANVVGTDRDITHSVVRQVLPKLGNIYRTKAALLGSWGSLDALRLPPVVELTKQRMFVASGSVRDRAVSDLVAKAHEGSFFQWALDAIMIGLTVLSVVPTAGVSLGLALTGLSYDIYGAMGEYEDYKLMSAASDTDLDKARSLSDIEPSLTPLLMRILGAGVNFTVAAGLFQRAVALRRMRMKSIEDEITNLNKAGEAVGVKGIGNEAVADTTPEKAPAAADEPADRLDQASSPQGETQGTSPAPAENTTLRGPARRHWAATVKQNTLAKEVNTVIEPGIDVAGDVAAIQAGKATRVNGNYVIHGRTYGVHDGTLYPISGPGFHQLNRGAYQALGVLNKFENTEQAHAILAKMKNVGPEEIEAALNVWRLL